MAIQISNQTVITDSRELTNITNLKTINSQSILGTGNIEVGNGIGNILHNGGTLLNIIDNPNANGLAESDYFAESVGISGNRAIVGAPGEDDQDLYSSGKAYIFDVETGVLLHVLNNPTAYSIAIDDFFGNSVGISGNRAIVGAPFEDASGADGSGKAYIFDVETGALLHVLNNPNGYSTGTNDRFGWSVAISGNYAIIGAYLEDELNNSESGKAYVFDVSTGVLMHTWNNPNNYSSAAGDQFGYSVAISGNRAIVGAPGEDQINGESSGKAYIFNVASGIVLHILSNPNGYGSPFADRFGQSVAISGNYAVVGAPQENDMNGAFSGKAYIYNVTTGALLHTLDNPDLDLNSEADYFGYSVAISGERAVIGAYGEDEGTKENSGKAYIFDVVSGTRVHTLDNPNADGTASLDSFGYSVGISGNYAIVGAYLEDQSGQIDSGKAYIFSAKDIYKLDNINSLKFLDGGELSSIHPIFRTAHSRGQLLHTLQSPYLPADRRIGDNFHVVATDGNYVVAASVFEGLSDSLPAGRAYVFDVVNSRLLHILTNPNLGPNNDDQFGFSMAVSGRYAIIGAPYEDQGIKFNTGTAYVFDIFTGKLLRQLLNPVDENDSYFGYSVDISGKYAIVGAYSVDLPSDSGRAFIYDITTGSIVLTLDNPNTYSTTLNDEFGWSVAISGSFAIVGTRLEDQENYTDSGKVYIYNIYTGALQHILNNPNPGNQHYFGDSLAAFGNYLIVSAPNENVGGQTDSGRAYIYEISTGTLLHILTNPNLYSTAANDTFGYSVDISEKYAIVGAPGEDGIGTGRAYLFDVATGSLLCQFVNSSANINEFGAFAFGRKVAVGKYAVVGDPFISSEEGRVYVFATEDQTYFEKLATIK
jgi:hypothetical protein